MWLGSKNITDDLDDYTEIPKDFKIEVPKFCDLDSIEIESKEVPKDDDVEVVENGMEKLRVSPLFEKYIPQNDWYMFFKDEIAKDYFKNIEDQYRESMKKTIIYPKKSQMFRAFNLTPIKSLKVVIIGQDPYPGQCPKTYKPYANGLAFSVKKECSIPKSLKNMYRELERSGFKAPKTGELENWAKQGVLLLNTQLSVEKGKANSHRFWNEFTDNVIKYISSQNKNIVFVLMGGNALKKYKFIKKGKNTKLVITSHPSPLGFKKNLKSYPPFWESNIFVNINNKLNELKLTKIKW